MKVPFFGHKTHPSKHLSSEHCSQVPSLLSTFVDTLVDYVVGEQFLGPKPTESSYIQHDSNINMQEGHTNCSKNDKKEDGQTIRGPTRIPAPERLIAIGDIHGDLGKAKEALLIAEVMDINEKWIGGNTIVVQVGDLLDRGGSEIKVIYLLEKLKREAQREGGNVHVLNGNHEIMNIEGEFSYATAKGIDEFKHWAHWYKMGNVLKERCKGLNKPHDFFQNIPKEYPDGHKARMAALRPGGPITSRFLAPHPMVLIAGGNVFVHGGVLPSHIDYGLDKINNESREWMEGRMQSKGPNYLHGENSLVWSRKFSEVESNMCDCKTLEKSLAAIPGAKRMVMGHTIQYENGINGVCDNKAVRVDVGMSRGCKDATPEVLEIQNDKIMTVISISTSKMLDLAKKSMAPYWTRNEEHFQKFQTPKSSTIKVPVKLQTSLNL